MYVCVCVCVCVCEGVSECVLVCEGESTKFSASFSQGSEQIGLFFAQMAMM